ncbi:MAG: hypothetical protein WAM81_11700 [Acidimicrobiia bacterium]
MDLVHRAAPEPSTSDGAILAIMAAVVLIGAVLSLGGGLRRTPASAT